jgi:hypothetical protein
MSDPLYDALRNLADVGALDVHSSDSIRLAAAKSLALSTIAFQRRKLLDEYRQSIGQAS